MSASASALNPLVYAFLKTNGFSKAAAKFVKEAGDSVKVLPVASEDLLSIFNKYLASRPTTNGKVVKASKTSSSESSSDSSEEEKAKKPAAKAKAPIKSVPKPSSSSDSSSEDDKSKKVPQKPVAVAKTKKSASSSESSSDSSEEEKAKKPAAKAKAPIKSAPKPSSSSSDSSSEDEKPKTVPQKPVAVAKTNGSSNKRKKPASSSESSSDSSSEDDSKKKTKRKASADNGSTPAAKRAKVDEDLSTPVAAVTPVQNGNGTSSGKKARTPGKPFQRVNPDEVTYLDPRLMDNSYEAKAKYGSGQGDPWGKKASETLSKVQGKDFRHEKTKKKRQSWRGGGSIDMGVNSIPFSFSDDE